MSRSSKPSAAETRWALTLTVQQAQPSLPFVRHKAGEGPPVEAVSAVIYKIIESLSLRDQELL